MGNGLQQLARGAGDALAVQHVAGIVIGQLEGLLGAGGAAIGVGQGLQQRCEALAEAHPGQKLLNVGGALGQAGGGCGPGGICGQQTAIGLDGVAAPRGTHQHGIEGVGSGGFAWAHHRLKAGDQGPGQLKGVGLLALVVGHGAATALVWWDHHFDAIGAQHLHRRRTHGRVKQPLHAAQQQAHPVATGAHRRHQLGQHIGKGPRGQGRQQPLHGLQLGAQQFGETGPPGQALQGGAGVGPQRRQHGPQPPRIGQQGKQQPPQGPLRRAAQLGGVELGAGGLDQLVVAHP